MSRTGLILVALSLLVGSVARGTSQDAIAEPLVTRQEGLAALQNNLLSSQWGAVIEEGSQLLEADGELSEKRTGEVYFALGFARAMRAAETGGAPAPVSAGTPAGGAAASEAPVLGAVYIAAAGDFTSSRALAGPGRLRSFATYDLGLAAFLRGDLWRATLPEIAQAGGQPAPTPQALPNSLPGGPGGSGASGAPDAEAPTPIEEARAAYLEAKDALIEALRADWRDEDTRANLELIQRRLAELDEIEEERKKQEESAPEDSSDEDGEDGEEGEEGEDSQEGDEGEEDPSEGDQEQEGDEKENSEEQDSSEQEKPDPDSETAENDVREGEELPEGEGEARSLAEPDAERHLTREEVIRLLDKLAEIEAEGEAVTGARASGQRAKVDRDW